MRYRTPAALEMAVKAAAKASPLDTNRAMAGFFFHRLLCRVFSEADSPFVLKGGQSMLARTIDARATRDIDLFARKTSLENAVEELKKLASVDLDDFITFEFGRIEPIKADDEYRNGAKIWLTPMLGSKKLQPISIDLVIDEIEELTPETITPADRLAIEGLPVFDYQIYRVECALADKLLAMLETHDGRPSSRVKDLADVIVYARTCEIDSGTLADRVAKEAAARKVTLPGILAIPQDWAAHYGKTFSKMATQAKIDNITPDLESAEQLAQKLYTPALDNPSNHMRWSPDLLRWIIAEKESG